MPNRMGTPFLEGVACGLALAGALTSAGIVFMSVQVVGSAPLLALGAVGAVGFGCVMFWTIRQAASASNLS